MTPEHDSQFDSLLARVADGVITPGELRQLGALLQGNTGRQQVYHDYLLTHLLLEQEGSLLAEADCELDPLEPAKALGPGNRPNRPSPARTTDATQARRFRRQVFRFALAAVVLLIAGVSTFMATQGSRSIDLATVVDAIGVDGAPRELVAEGAVLDVGLPLQFEAGLVSIAMPSGAEFVVEGPASIVVRGSNHVRLDKGKLYASVPPRATGFTVENNAVSLIDLGTEFGIDARPDGAVDTYVFLGRVRADAEQGQETLSAGQAVTASMAGELGSVRAFDEAKTTFTRSLDGTSYLDVVERLGPVFLHRFSSSGNRRWFPSDLGRGRYVVSLRGGVYAAAGGPIATPKASDGYLRFVGVESTSTAGSVSEALDGTGEYSVVAWVRVDEPGYQGIAALVGQNGPESDLGFVLRVTNNGRLEHRCHYGDRAEYVQQSSSTPLPRRRWAHVVATGGSQQPLDLYVNGERVAKPVTVDGVIRPDCDSLLLGSGSGRELEEYLHTGPLRGAVDEVGVFDRRLSGKEVAELYSSSAYSKTTPLL